MSLAAFLPLRSPYPHQRSPPNAFSPRLNFSPRPVLAPMSRIPRIETASSSRRVNDLPRDPSDWVDKDLLSYVRYNYSPVEAVPLSEVIERDRLTPTALWYLQAEPEQLLAIAEEESLRDTLLGLALSLKPAVSPTSPRIRHVRRLSEDLEHPPPPPPPPPPSPPTPEEPELEEDDDAAESVVSDWALDEDLDPTPTVDGLDDLVESAVQPEPPLEGLGLHTGEPHLDNVTTSQPQPIPVDIEDLINLEEDPQPSAPQEEAPEPHTTPATAHAADDPLVEEPASSQSTSADAHVSDAAEEKPPAAMHHADPFTPSDEPSASREAGASMRADPFAGSSTLGSPIEDDDLGNPWADSEDISGPDPSPTLPPADPARTATPTSDYHDANSTHSGEGERPEATPAEQEPEPSPVRPQDGPTTSGSEDQSSTEAPLPAETPVQGESGENASSGDAAPTPEEVQPEENLAPASSEDPIEPPPPAIEPIQTAPPATDPVQAPPPADDPALTSPSITAPAQPSSSVTDPVSTPVEETAQTLVEDVSPAAAPEHDDTAHAGPDQAKDAQADEPPAQSTTATSGSLGSDQSQDTAKAEGGESAHLGGEEAADKVGEEIVERMGEEVVDRMGEGEEEAVPAITTTEPAETTVPPEATTDTVDNSPAPEGSSGDDASGVQANAQASASGTQAVQVEAEVNSSSTMQDESTLEKSLTPSEPPATESAPSPSLLTDAITEPTTTAFDPPPSPTVILASGIEAQLIDRDPESTEQTPSASPGDTPPNESSSPGESRQASPPAEIPVETEAEKPPLAPLGRIPSSSSVSPVTSAEGKSQALPRLKTAFGSLSEPSHSARPPTHSRTDNSAWQRPPTFGSALSPATKGVAWKSAQSPASRSAGSWGRGLFSSVTSSMTSFLNPQSEPSTRDSSPEREPSGPRTPFSPAPHSARQASAPRQSPWDKNRNRPALAASSSSTQPASRPEQPPTLAAEPSVSVSPAQVSPPADIDTNTNTSIPTPAPSSDPSPPEGSATQETNQKAEELMDVASDSVLVESGTPSAGNGEPVRDAESSQAPTVQAVASSEADSPDVNGAGGKDGIETNDAEDEDLVTITRDDVADADKEAVSEPQPQGGLIGGEDDDDDAPLDRRLARVRQITSESISSTVTSDTETQGEDERRSRPRGPKVDITDLPKDTEGVDSPVVDSPAVGSPSATTSAAEKKRLKKLRARQRAKANNKPANDA